MDCYNKACSVNPDCYEAQFNRLLLQWKLGQVFDEDLCHQIRLQITDKYSAQLMIMTFRKAIGLPLDIAEEKKILQKMYGTNTQQHIDSHDGKMRNKVESAEKKAPKLFTTIALRLHSKYS